MTDTQKVPLWPRVKSGMMGLVVGLVVAGGGAGWVYYTEHGFRAEAETKLSVSEARGRLLEARVAVARAQGELARSNFGAAQDEVKRATLLLALVDGAALGVAEGPLANAVSVSQQLIIRADAAPDANTERLIELAAQLDALIKG